jgi:biopolymer transport protein ExbD
MKFARRARQDIDVNMTPLIDVVFLLLIFFMVSTTFTKESRLGLNLPKAVVGENKPIHENNIEVIIDAKGQITISGQKIADNDRRSIKTILLEKFTEKNQSNNQSPKPTLTITADAATAHQHVISTMDIAGQIGFSKLSITTLKEETQQ